MAAVPLLINKAPAAHPVAPDQGEKSKRQTIKDPAEMKTSDWPPKVARQVVNELTAPNLAH